MISAKRTFRSPNSVADSSYVEIEHPEVDCAIIPRIKQECTSDIMSVVFRFMYVPLYSIML